MKKFLAPILVLLLSTAAMAADVCSGSLSKSSVKIANSSTAILVTGAANLAVHVCQYNFTAAAGTSATYTFKYGTGTTCGTGTVALTGDYVGAAGLEVQASGPGDLFTVGPSLDLCIVLGGTGGSAQGLLTYVIVSN